MLLITVLWYTHSQKIKLHSEVDRHIHEKDGLLKQIGHLGESVSSKTRELQDLHTRHAHVSESMNKVGTRGFILPISINCIMFLLRSLLFSILYAMSQLT